MTWDQIVTAALVLAGTEAAAYYGKPSVKANGHPIVTQGPDDTCFCLHVDRDTIDMLKETDPETFFQTPHYAGWPTVLVRFATNDPERVEAMIERSRDQAMARKKKR